jgi:hypothetical protein
MSRNILLFTLLCAFLAVGSLVRGAPDEGADPTGGAKYLGEAKCKMCHIQQHKTWQAMKHAKAFEALPEKYRNMDAKTEDGRTCVSCHVTGYGMDDRDGFVDPAASASLLNVQCEACHGPGSNHVDAAKAIMKDKRKEFNADEKTYIIRKNTNCSDCHNPHENFEKFKE